MNLIMRANSGRALQRAKGFMMYVNPLHKVSTIFSAENAYAAVKTKL